MRMLRWLKGVLLSFLVICLIQPPSTQARPSLLPLPPCFYFPHSAA